MAKLIQDNFKILEPDTIADLRELTADVNGVVAIIKGYTTVGDGGSGPDRYWDQDKAIGYYTDNNSSIIVPNGGDGSAAWLWTETPSELRPEWFGGFPGLSDISTQLQACNDLGPTILSEGVYNYVMGTTFTLNNTIRGQGKGSILNFSSSSTSFFTLIDPQENISIKDLSINWTTPVGSSGIVVFNMQYDGVFMDDISVDAGVIATSGVLNASNHIWNITGDSSNIRIINSYFTAYKFGVLKTNTSTATNRNWEFSGNIFELMFAPTLTFNTPSGDWDDVRVTNNYFKDNFGESLTPASFPHFGGVAGSVGSGRYIFSDNIFTGTGDGLHFEEGAEQIVISGNSFYLNMIPIQILDNNVGGTPLIPKLFTITSNIIVNSSGTKTDTYGIEFILDGTTLDAARDVIISNNIISGFERGITTDKGIENLSIKNNLIRNCTIGLRMSTSNGDVKNNFIKECDTAISNVLGGGLVGNNTIMDCTDILTSDNFTTGATGFDIQAPTAVVGSGSGQLVPLIAATSKEVFNFEAIFEFTSSAISVFRYGKFSLSWDGATLTGGGSAIFEGGQGTITTVIFVVSGGNLSLSMNNTSGSAQTLDCKVTLNGGYFTDS